MPGLRMVFEARYGSYSGFDGALPLVYLLAKPEWGK